MTAIYVACKPGWPVLLLASELLYVCITLLCLGCEADIACLVYRRPASHQEGVEGCAGKRELTAEV